MSEHEGRSPAFYDHEIDEPRATGRRRRQVADWGVGEDVFDRLPSRRFDRRGEEHRPAGRHEDFGEWEPAEPVDETPERIDEPDEAAGFARTIVIGGAVEDEIPPPEPRERRTIVIGGHPDGLPAVRRRRPPRTAVERMGTSPDRIVAYTVALGFLLILIAILTTGH